MIGLSDRQMQIVMAAAGNVPAEKRKIFLQRIAAMLKQRGHFNDDDLIDVVHLALTGLVQQPAA